MKENCSDRIKKALTIRGMKPIDLVEKSGVKKSALSQYMSGKIIPRQNSLHMLATALEVDEGWLMGYDVPMEKRKNLTATNEFKDPVFPEGASQMFRVDTRGLTPEIAKEFMEELEEYSKFLLSKFKKK